MSSYLDLKFSVTQLFSDALTSPFCPKVDAWQSPEYGVVCERTRRTHYHAFLAHVTVTSLLFPQERLLRVPRVCILLVCVAYSRVKRKRFCQSGTGYSSYCGIGTRNTGFRSAHFNFNPVNIPCWIKGLWPMVKKMHTNKEWPLVPCIILGRKKRICIRCGDN